MLCRRSAILMSTTRMSLLMVSSSFRKFSACADALSPKMPPEIFVNPDTISAIFLPNCASMSSTVYSVSSTTSCSRAEQIDVDPSPISWLTMRATSMGCMIYGSPLRRRTPLCASQAKRNARSMMSTFLRWLLARYPSRSTLYAPFTISSSSFGVRLYFSIEFTVLVCYC